MFFIPSLKRSLTSLVIILALLVGVLPTGYGFTICHASNGQTHVEFSLDSRCSCPTISNEGSCCPKANAKGLNISSTSDCHHDETLVVSDSGSLIQPSLIKQLLSPTLTLYVIQTPYSGWFKREKRNQVIVHQQKPPPYDVNWLQFVQIKQATVIQV